MHPIAKMRLDKSVIDQRSFRCIRPFQIVRIGLEIRCSSHAMTHRIAMNVAAKIPSVFIGIHQCRLKAIFKQGAAAPMKVVDYATYYN